MQYLKRAQNGVIKNVPQCAILMHIPPNREKSKLFVNIQYWFSCISSTLICTIWITILLNRHYYQIPYENGLEWKKRLFMCWFLQGNDENQLLKMEDFGQILTRNPRVRSNDHDLILCLNSVTTRKLFSCSHINLIHLGKVKISFFSLLKGVCIRMAHCGASLHFWH